MAIVRMDEESNNPLSGLECTLDAYLGDQSSSEAPESLSQRHAALWTSRRRSEREERERARQERHIVAILARAWALPDAYYADLNLPVWLDAAPYVMRKTGSVRESVGLVGKPDGARPGETLGGGGSTTLQTRGGQTMLHLAARHDMPLLTRFLVEHGADAEALDDNGLSPLHTAAWLGNVDVVKTLITGTTSAPVPVTTRTELTLLWGGSHVVFGDALTSSRGRERTAVRVWLNGRRAGVRRGGAGSLGRAADGSHCGGRALGGPAAATADRHGRRRRRRRRCRQSCECAPRRYLADAAQVAVGGRCHQGRRAIHGLGRGRRHGASAGDPFGKAAPAQARQDVVQLLDSALAGYVSVLTGRHRASASG